MGVYAYAGCDSGAPCQGTVTCACYPNNTCNDGLTCASNLCVSLNSDAGPPGTGTSSSTSSSSSSGAGGADGGGTPHPDGGDDAGGSGTGDGGPGPGGEVLANTDLSQDWYIAFSSGNAASMGLSGGQYCFMAAANNGYSFVFGYPDPNSNATDVSLVAGASYTFSYQVSGSGVATGPDLCSSGPVFEAKIAQAVSPFTQQVYWCDSVPSSLTTVTHTFTANGANPLTGLGIALEANLSTGGQICIANVQLVQN